MADNTYQLPKDEVLVKQYELAMVLAPNLEEKDRDELLELIRKMIVNWGGQVDKTSEDGKKVLAYPIAKFTEAYFYFWDISLPTNKVNELDTRVRYEEKIIRHLLVKADE